MEMLPKNWVKTSISDVGIVVTGNTPSKKKPEFYGGNIPWVKPGDLRSPRTIFETEDFLTIIGAEKARLIPKGSVMVTCIGNLGNVGIAGKKLATNQQINSIVFFDSINSKYGFYYSRTLRKWLVENSTSTTISMVNKKNFERAPFLLPPLAEQQRIVAKLDGLFGHLERINKRVETLMGLRGKYVDSCLIDSSTKAFYLRKKVGQFLEEGTKRIGENWEGFRLIGVSAKEGVTDLRIGQKKTFEKYKIVKPGDFLYNTMRVNIGSIAIYEGEEIALTSPDYVVFRVNKYLSSHMLLAFLKSKQGLLEIGANTKGSVRARLYFSALSEIRMPIAPEYIQGQAEKFLSRFDESLKSLQFLQENQLKSLPQAILAKAFKGELVEQLESDGNAEDLLKEIAALKAEAVKGKKKGRK